MHLAEVPILNSFLIGSIVFHTTTAAATAAAVASPVIVRVKSHITTATFPKSESDCDKFEGRVEKLRVLKLFWTV